MCLCAAASILGLTLAPTTARAQYSDDLGDVKTDYLILGHFALGNHAPSPVGDLGPIETLVDLRGFVPLSHLSKSKFWAWNVYAARWYKVPTRKAMLIFYFGDLSIDSIATDASTKERTRFTGTRFLRETEARGETKEWCTVAYDLAQKDGAALFENLVGGTFDGAEPTTVFLTRDSSFVVINFKYRQFNVGDYGQALVALELSRASHRLRTAYFLYSTTVFSKSTAAFLRVAAPLVANVAGAVFQ